MSGVGGVGNDGGRGMACDLGLFLLKIQTAGLRIQPWKQSHPTLRPTGASFTKPITVTQMLPLGQLYSACPEGRRGGPCLGHLNFGRHLGMPIRLVLPALMCAHCIINVA